MTDFGTAVGDELYAAQAPLAADDESYGFALRVYSRALGSMFEEVAWYAAETDTMPGWARLVDLDTTPAKALGWLAQFVGVRLDPSLDDAAQRARIRATDGFNRGTLAAIVAAAQQYLTGMRRVVLVERAGGDAYALALITYTSETPDSGLVLAAVTAQKPAGILLTYNVLNGQTFAQLKANYATFAAVKANYPTFAAVRDDNP